MAHIKTVDSASVYIGKMEEAIAKTHQEIESIRQAHPDAQDTISKIAKVLAEYVRLADATLGGLSREESEKVRKATDDALTKFFTWNKVKRSNNWAYSEGLLNDFQASDTCTKEEIRLIKIFYSDVNLRYSRFMYEHKSRART